MKGRCVLTLHLLRGIAVVLLPLSFAFLSPVSSVQAKSTKKKKQAIILPAKYLIARRGGAAYYKAKEYYEAERLFLDALKIIESEKNGFEEHVRVLLDLSATYSQLNRVSDAQRRSAEAIALVRKKYGSNSSQLPALLSYDANLYPTKSAIRETRLKEALKISEDLVGRDNPSLLHLLGHLHSIYLGTAAGIPYGKRVYEMRSKIPSWKTNSNSFNNAIYLALDYMDAGDFKTAEALAEEAEKLVSHTSGKGSSQALWTKGITGICYEKLGKKELAQKKLKECVDGFKKVEAYDEHYWNMHRQTANCLLQYDMPEPALAIALDTVKTVKASPEVQDPLVLLPTQLIAINAACRSGNKQMAEKLFSVYQNDVRKLYKDEKTQEQQLKIARSFFAPKATSGS